MVVHDETRITQWTAAKSKPQEAPRTVRMQMSVVAVQSIACGVVVLLVVLLRMAGGEAYQSLRRSFQQALTRNEWVSAIAQHWDGDPLEKVKFDSGKDVKQDDFTSEETAPVTGNSQALTAVLPLSEGTLTSGYGNRTHPVSGVEEFHTGTDIAAPNGTALVAMYDGEVTEVGEDSLLGRYVCLTHAGGVEVLYGHCQEILAPVGAVVRAGERVALVGSTGVSTGSHVHIRIRVNGVLCDPASILPLEQYA